MSSEPKMTENDDLNQEKNTMDTLMRLLSMAESFKASEQEHSSVIENYIDSIFNPDKRIPPTFPDDIRAELKSLRLVDAFDDNGKQYLKDGKLLPNTTYSLGGNVYRTDAGGRIIKCKSKPKRTPENMRSTDSSANPTDQLACIVSRELNGDSGSGNTIAMDPRISMGDYKKMESDIKDKLNTDENVDVDTTMTYSGDSERPDMISAAITADGKKTEYTFNNNMDNSLLKEVASSSKKAVDSLISETGGIVSSIKKDFDKSGKLIKTTVTVAYTVNGKSCRKSI